MKNLKVGKKFLLSFGIILALFLVAVISSSVGIMKAKGSYESFYEEDYRVITNIYEMRVSLQRSLKELMLSVVELDDSNTRERIASSDQYLTHIQESLQWIYTNYTGDSSLMKGCEAADCCKRNPRHRGGQWDCPADCAESVQSSDGGVRHASADGIRQYGEGVRGGF